MIAERFAVVSGHLTGAFVAPANAGQIEVSTRKSCADGRPMRIVRTDTLYHLAVDRGIV